MKKKDTYFAVFYVILAIILLILGWIQKEIPYLWASVVIALIAFYWIWKAWK